jgi:PIN domain nuclease of toxin-antitoxin system
LSAYDRLLLDTHVAIWWLLSPSRIPASTRKAIGNADQVFVSAVSAWEATIKSGLGRLELPSPIELGLEESGFDQLNITFPHAAAVRDLPLHHRDPFDRLLVAQAVCERLTLVTHDRNLAPYPIDILWS